MRSQHYRPEAGHETALLGIFWDNRQYRQKNSNSPNRANGALPRFIENELKSSHRMYEAHLGVKTPARIAVKTEKGRFFSNLRILGKQRQEIKKNDWSVHLEIKEKIHDLSI